MVALGSLGWPGGALRPGLARLPRAVRDHPGEHDAAKRTEGNHQAAHGRSTQRAPFGLSPSKSNVPVARFDKLSANGRFMLPLPC